MTARFHEGQDVEHIREVDSIDDLRLGHPGEIGADP